MSTKIQIKQSWSQLGSIGEKTHKALEKALKSGAVAVQRGAMIRTSRVKTGAMRSAWTVSLENWSDYERVRAAAQSLNPDAETFDEVKPMDPLTAYISNAMEYAIYNEMGTVRLAATPMLVPAVEEVRPTLANLVATALREAGIA